jgi:predicted nuclease of predicted toxin-antitoxin system
MKCKLDENLGDLGRDLLEAAGHDVMTVAQQSMSGSDDDQIYAVCRNEDRVLVILDYDFSHVRRFPPTGSAGIVILECRGRMSPGSIRARISELIVAVEREDVRDHLWIVEPGRVRIRQRP